MIPVHSRITIDVGLFKQKGGWVFIGVSHGAGFYAPPLFSGKRKTLALAIEAAKAASRGLDPPGECMVYCRLDN